ncbi:hypothetical protein ACFQX7_30535 [Luedemannella flava]
MLGGGIRVALGRTDFTARLLAGGLRVRTLAGLGSLRFRDDREHREGRRLGLDPFETEADMMTIGMRRFVGLSEPISVREGDGWWHRVWAGQHPGVEEIHVLAAPSTQPPRRANTADTLIGWAEHVGTLRRTSASCWSPTPRMSATSTATRYACSAAATGAASRRSASTTSRRPRGDAGCTPPSCCRRCAPRSWRPATSTTPSWPPDDGPAGLHSG